MSNHPAPDNFRRWPLTSLVLVLVLALLFNSAAAQTVSRPAEPPQPVPGIGTTVQGQPRQSQTESAEEPKPITKAQAKELFRSVDSILQFVSQDTGLPIKHKVKRKLITRDQVEKYVEKRMKEDKDAQRLERSQLVLKKFGLIPQNYDLHAEFLKLLSEQVAAYYDSRTKTVNLLDWVQPDLQRPVLAHELTHALQDQSFNLQKWSLAGAPNDNPLPDQKEQIVEEAQAARQNVAEGQAMMTMFDYTLAPASLSVLKAPDIVNAMRADMADPKDSPVLAAAPVFLRESLMMPYTFGLDFVRTVLTKQGKAAAYTGMLERPPVDTLQVMEPDAYLQGKAASPLTIPDLDRLIAPDYERYDFGGMGAFDVFLLAKQYVPENDPKEYYSHWRGGYYLAARVKTTPKHQIELIYLSRWDSLEAAQAFARLYSGYVPTRYHLEQAAMVGSVGTGDQTITWDATQQGKVVIQIHGNDVLVLEGLDETARKRISTALLPGLQSAR